MITKNEIKQETNLIKKQRKENKTVQKYKKREETNTLEKQNSSNKRVTS